MRKEEDFARNVEGDLKLWASGKDAGLARVLETGYHGHFRPMAINLLAGGRFRGVIQPEDLIHRAYFILIKLKNRRFEHVPAFLALFKHTMERVLIDLIRGERAAMRGGKNKHKNRLSIEKCEEWLND